MASTWILKKKRGGLVVWQAMGGDPPGVVVDNSTYHTLLNLYFPELTVTWGPGDFEMVLVSDGATYRIGSVESWSAKKKAGTGEPETMTYTREQTRFDANRPAMDTSARIAGDPQEEAHNLLGSTGLPKGVIIEDGIPQDDPKPAQVAFGAPLQIVADVSSITPAVRAELEKIPEVKGLDDRLVGGYYRPDSPTFTLLLRNVRKTILLSEPTWADRLRVIPDLEVVRNALHTKSGAPKGILTGYKYLGFILAEQTTLDPSFFLLEAEPKLYAYLRFWEGFQRLEAYVGNANETKLSLETAMGVAGALLVDAATLYLLEVGATPGQPSPSEILVQIKEVAEFVACKDAEYGQPIRRQGITGVVTRMFDKIARYTTLKAQASETIRFESVADSAKDLIGYALILAGFMEEHLERAEHDATCKG